MIKEQLHERREQADGTRTLVVWGLGGSGKSQLVLNYVREYQQDYAAIFWLEAGQRESIERDYIQIYRQLFEPAGVRGREVLRMEDVVPAVKNWFYTQIGRSLMVFDSADAIDEGDDASYIDLNFFLPDAPLVDIIITTWSARAMEMTELEAVKVGEMEKSEAVDLFYMCSRLQSKEPGDAEEVSTITEELGKLALAITLAGSYVAVTPRLRSNIRLFLPEYRTRRKKLLSMRAKKLIHQYGGSVLSTWETSFAAVARQSAVAARLLSLLAFLNFDDISPALFERVHALGPPLGKGNESDRLWQSYLSPDGPMDQYAVESAFVVLQTYSLVQLREDQGGYAMHKLVHAWGSERLDEDERRQVSVIALQLLVQVLPTLKGVMEKVRIVPHATANFGILSVAFHTDRLETIILDWVAMIGDFLDGLGRWSELDEIRRFHLVKTREVFGAEHPSTLTSVNNLAEVLQYRGKYEAAEDMNRQALAEREKVLGVEHPDTLTSISNLALVLKDQGKYEAAEEMNRRALAGKEKVLGVEHPDTLVSVSNLALVLRYQGKYEAAEEMNRRALAGYEKVLGVEHPDTLVSVNNLALVLQHQGKYEAAEEMNRRALAGKEKVLGVEHPSTLTSVSNLALVLRHQGKYEAAEEMNRRALVGYEKVLGVEHPDTLTNVHCLAYLLHSQQQYEQASILYQRALSGRQRILGPTHPMTLACRRHYSSMLQEMETRDRKQ
jgi:tetratricopeptide (TPR) repeat protein